MDFKEYMNKEVLNEKFQNKDVTLIVDEFVRFLIGNRKTACSRLQKFTKVEIPVDTDAGEYNKVYSKLLEDISKAISKNLEV